MRHDEIVKYNNIGHTFIERICLQGMRHFIHTNAMNDEIKELNILIKTLTVSSAKFESGFSQHTTI